MTKTIKILLTALIPCVLILGFFGFLPNESHEVLAQSQQTISFNAGPPSMVNGGTYSIVGTPGNRTFYYLVIAHYPRGVMWASSPTNVFIRVDRAPATIDGSNYVRLSWNPISAIQTATGPDTGLYYYSVIRLTSPYFTGSCNACLVATNITTNTTIDQTNVLVTNHSVGQAIQSVSAQLNLDNTNDNVPELKFLSPNATMRFSIPMQEFFNPTGTGTTQIILRDGPNQTCTGSQTSDLLQTFSYSAVFMSGIDCRGDYFVMDNTGTSKKVSMAAATAGFFQASSDSDYCWSDQLDINNTSSVIDLCLSRSAQNVLEINTGTLGTTADLSNRRIQLHTAAEPTCNVANRGMIDYVAGGAGVADTIRICLKNNMDMYAWTALN